MEGGRNKGNRRRTPKVPVGDPGDPSGMVRAVEDHLEWLAIRQFSATTLVTRRQQLEAVTAWLYERGITRPADVTRPILQRYQRWLFLYRKPADGKPLSVRVQFSRLSAVRVFFRWLARENRILYNPAADLDMPKVGRQLPKDVLTVSEVERVLAQADLTTPLGVRDRAILEVFYATGIRRRELAFLGVWDVDVERQVLWIREGKGRKDRVVPLGERALMWVEKYRHDVRPGLATGFPSDDGGGGNGGYLFLNYLGEQMGLHFLTHTMREYVKAAGLNKWGSCHLFRHTCATLMLEGGADIRYVKEMLGHALMETTAVYTQVAITQLQRVHTATHPGATLHGPRSDRPS
jgi:integrase/recombinase XerD